MLPIMIIEGPRFTDSTEVDHDQFSMEKIFQLSMSKLSCMISVSEIQCISSQFMTLLAQKVEEKMLTEYVYAETPLQQ